MNKQTVMELLFQLDPFGTLCQYHEPPSLDEYESEANDVISCMEQNQCSIHDALNIVLQHWDPDFTGFTPEEERMIHDFI